MLTTYKPFELLLYIRDYAEGCTSDITFKLRTGKRLNPKYKDIDTHLSAAIDTFSSPLNTTLYRVVDSNDLKRYYGIDFNNIEIGSSWIDKGFVSTSKKLDGCDSLCIPDNVKVVLIINCASTVKGVDINKLLGSNSPSPSQEEFLLNKNTKFEVTDIDKDKRILYIKAS